MKLPKGLAFDPGPEAAPDFTWLSKAVVTDMGHTAFEVQNDCLNVPQLRERIQRLRIFTDCLQAAADGLEDKQLIVPATAAVPYAHS